MPSRLAARLLNAPDRDYQDTQYLFVRRAQPFRAGKAGKVNMNGGTSNRGKAQKYRENSGKIPESG